MSRLKARTITMIQNMMDTARDMKLMDCMTTRVPHRKPRPLIILHHPTTNRPITVTRGVSADPLQQLENRKKISRNTHIRTNTKRRRIILNLQEELGGDNTEAVTLTAIEKMENGGMITRINRIDGIFFPSLFLVCRAVLTTGMFFFFAMIL